MIPDQATRPMSYWAVRAELARRGRLVSDKQLKRFAGYGLLERVGGGLAPETPDRVESILAAEGVARSLPRRVVYLRGNYLQFPVPAEHLRRALIWFAPTIQRPIRKLRAVERARAVMAGRWSGRQPKTRPRRLPAVSAWTSALSSAPVSLYEARVTGWYTLARDILPAYAQEAKVDLESIPLEERVALIAVLDLLDLSPR